MLNSGVRICNLLLNSGKRTYGKADGRKFVSLLLAAVMFVVRCI